MDNYPIRTPFNEGVCCGHSGSSHNIGASTCIECLLVNPADTHVFNASLPSTGYEPQPQINATGT